MERKRRFTAIIGKNAMLRRAESSSLTSWLDSFSLLIMKVVAITVPAVSNLDMAGIGDVGRELSRSNASGAAPRGRSLSRRWILPFTLVAATPPLLWWSFISWASVRCDAPGPEPAMTLLSAMNTPLLLARVARLPVIGALEVTTAVLFADAAYAAAVGLLWVWVVLNFESLRRHHVVYMFRSIPLRVSGDIILVAVGALSGLMAQVTLERIGPFPRYPGVSCFGSDIRLWWVSMLVAGCLYAGWCLALVGLFGRDLVQAVRGKTGLQAVPL